MELTFYTRAELCECINEVIKLSQGDFTLKQLIGEAKSLEEASNNLSKKLERLFNENEGKTFGTQIGLIARRYIHDDCNGCKLPIKYCRCTIRYNCEF